MRRLRLSPFAAAVALTLGATGAAQAEGNLLLQLPPIEGSATVDGHAKWIELGSLQWGVGVGISPGLAGSARRVSKPSFSDITWTQAMDRSAVGLMGNVLRGTITEKATFDLTRPVKSAQQTYLQLEAERAAVTGVQMANDTVDASLGYSKLTMAYTPATESGSLGAPVKISYDLGKNEPDGLLNGGASIGPSETPSAQNGQTSMYLRLGTGNASIFGDNDSKGYENWIKIDSAQMGVGLSFSPAGPGAKPAVSKPSISDLTWSQTFDQSVPYVLANLLKGNAVSQAVIEYVTMGANGPTTFMQLALNDVLFSGLSLSTGGGLPNVSTSMNFTSFSQTVWDIRDDGTRSQPLTVGYDVLTQKYTGGHLASFGSGPGAGNLAPLANAAGQVTLPPGAAQMVPEPQSWALMLAGGALLAGLARRRRG